jgi:hypothetical protein
MLELGASELLETSAIAEKSYSRPRSTFLWVRECGQLFFEVFEVLKRYLLMFNEAIFDSKVDR